MKCIVFDFDGTIFNSKEIAQKAMTMSVQELNMKKLNINLYNKPLFYPELLIRTIGIEKKLSLQEEKQLLISYKKHLVHEESVAGANAAIVGAIKKFKDSKEVILAIYSDRKTANLVSLITRINLIDCFCIVCGRDMMKPKPSTEFIEYLLRRYNIHRTDILFIGDTDVDYMVARKSGIHYAHAKYSSELSNKSWKYCDEIVENPSEIEKVMENFIQYGMGDKKSRNSQISQ